jgi:hypothetical protein
VTTQAALRARLRRLIDDTGHGYSQSAPGFSTDISTLAVPTLRVQMDQEITAQDILLGAPADLVTGQAIAAAIQYAIRAADPATPPDTTPGYQNISCTFDPKEGYIIRSGTSGSSSAVRILTAGTGNDAAAALKLGLMNGGYETWGKSSLSDQELDEILDEAVQAQNAASGEFWDYATLPAGAETLVTYRAWASTIDVSLGRSANYFWQKVQAEETHEDQVFSNYLKLAEWLKDKIDDMQDDLEGGIVNITTTRWDRPAQSRIGIDRYVNPNLNAGILAALPGPNPGEILVEFDAIYQLGIHELYLGYKPTVGGVIDRTVFTDPNYLRDYDARKGFEAPSVLARTLRRVKDNFVKISGLTPATTYFIAFWVLDISGNRYFSNEVEVILP